MSPRRVREMRRPGRVCQCQLNTSRASHRMRRAKKSFPDHSYYSIHDFLRFAIRGSSPTTTNPSTKLASSTCSSLRSNPVPSDLYQAAFVAHATALPRLPRVPQHEFSPRTIGGTTYFPIRLGNARLGYHIHVISRHARRDLPTFFLLHTSFLPRG